MASSYQDDFTQGSDEANEMHCEQCEEFGESAVAEGFCVKCLEYMCKSCLKYHERHNQQHKLQDRKTMPQDFCFEQCPVHQNKFIRFYCSVCERFACNKCRKNDHKKCTDIGHVSTIAKGIENSEELKELYTDIKRISTELDRTKGSLNTCIQLADSQEKQDKRAIEKKREDRKIHFRNMQQTLIDKFDRYITDVTTVIRQIQQEKTTCLTTELNEVDKEQTVKEQNTLESLERVTAADISKMKSYLAKSISFNDGIQAVLSDLNQKQKSAERCKLLLALKTAVPAIKIQKQKIQEFTGATECQVARYLPEQAKESTCIIESNTRIEVPGISTPTELPDDFDVERMRDFFRKTRKLTCSNTKCGVHGSGKFCQECGHIMVESAVCTGKLRDSRFVYNGHFPMTDISGEEHVMYTLERPTKILVRNLPVTVHEEYLEMFFENTRKYGGGPVLHVDFDEDNQSAVVEFEEPEAVDTVLAKCPIRMFGQAVAVEVYKPQLQPPKPELNRTIQVSKPEPNRTIQVSGVEKSMPRDILELYFESTRKSGGGEVETVESDEEDGVLYITFASSYDAVNVASKRHTVEGRKLSVALYKPKYYSNKILIKGLKPSTNEDVLFNFIEAKSAFIPETMVYHAKQQGVVMITFSDNPDLMVLQKVFKRSKLEGASLKVYRVQVTHCIIVTNLPKEIDKDTIEFYFENKRKSGGEQVERVLMNDNGTCLVLFTDFATIDRVIERKHMLLGRLVDVKRYHKCLGGPEG